MEAIEKRAKQPRKILKTNIKKYEPVNMGEKTVEQGKRNGGICDQREKSEIIFLCTAHNV